MNASNIATAIEADPFDLQRHAWDIVRDRLDSRHEMTIDDVSEQFLMDPTYPIPGNVGAVVDAVKTGLDGKPVLAHRGGEFTKNLSMLQKDKDHDTILVREDSVERWSVDEVEAELRSRFGVRNNEIDLGAFEIELSRSTETWVHDQSPGDAVKMAAGRLTNEDHYVLISGSEILDKVRSDATLRDVSETETIGASEVRNRIEETIDSANEAATGQVLEAIRNDTEVYLPQADTNDAFRGAASTLLSEEYKLKTGDNYVRTLGDRSPTSITIVPMVPNDVGE